MKSLTRWSYDHPWPARILITVLHLLLALTAILFGTLLFSLDIYLPIEVKYGGITLFLVGTLLYPMRSSRLNLLACNYRNSRWVAGLLLVSSFIMISGGMNYRIQTVMQESPPPGEAYQVVPIVFKERPASRELQRRERRERREMRRDNRQRFRSWRSELRTAVKALRENTDSGEKAILTILAVLGALVLLYGVLALSCSLACSGAEGAAYLVFFAGLGIIVWLLIVVIRRIHRGPPTKLTEPSQS
jgi:hypothetical protein